MGNNLPAIMQVREELAPMRAEFGSVLPGHISPDKFMQVCITAIENNPDLLNADRQSFKVACLNAANDGLLPDKREGAFVIFNTEVDVRKSGSSAVHKERVRLVQWLPMITGVLKKAYQSGQVQSISVEMVHENDEYSRAAGDEAKIVHVPLDFGDRGGMKGAYAIITMKDGGIYREVMSAAQIEKVRNVSKTKDRGPWVAFYEEMVKKTILRRLLKRVPLSTEVDQVLARDDVFYDLDQERRSALTGPAGGSPVARPALFSNRPAVRKRLSPATETAEEAPEAETPAAQVVERDHEGLPVHDATEDMIEADADAQEDAAEAGGPQVGDTMTLGDGEPQIITDVVTESDGEARFVLRATLRPKQVTEFDNVDFWYGDIRQKMKGLSTMPDELRGFWKLNAPLIEEAGRNGFAPQAMKLIEYATELGLIKAADHAE